jgi:glucose-1-phosphate thymidylyltransferase
MKGIVLAGGTGSRLWPITFSTCKQLLPVYNKPLIYYPISTLMLAGIREILIITTPADSESFKTLLGDGSKFGVNFEYVVQPSPAGIAEAFVLGEDFIANESAALILGDNLFHGSGLAQNLEAAISNAGATIFTYDVSNPSDYGVIELDQFGKPLSIEEKPQSPKSNHAITGLYFFPPGVSDRAKKLTPSKRGEIEITELIKSYLASPDILNVERFSRGLAWLDTGSAKSLHDASTFVRVVEERTGTKIGCLEEVSWRKGWISDEDLKRLASAYPANEYGNYLRELASH